MPYRRPHRGLRTITRMYAELESGHAALAEAPCPTRDRPRVGGARRAAGRLRDALCASRTPSPPGPRRRWAGCATPMRTVEPAVWRSERPTTAQRRPPIGSNDREMRPRLHRLAGRQYLGSVTDPVPQLVAPLARCCGVERTETNAPALRSREREWPDLSTNRGRRTAKGCPQHSRQPQRCKADFVGGGSAILSNARSIGGLTARRPTILSPGEWLGIPDDFVSGEGDTGQPDLPDRGGRLPGRYQSCWTWAPRPGIVFRFSQRGLVPHHRWRGDPWFRLPAGSG